MQFRVLGVRDAASQSVIINAADRATARKMAAANGLTVIEITDAAPGSAALRLPRWGASSETSAKASGDQRFSVDLFCQELLALLTAGISVGEALETLATKEQLSAGRGVVDGLLRTVREGRPLSTAMAQRPDIFPSLLSESLRAAERTSDYEPALARFVRYRKLSREVRGKLMAASIYPLILLAVSGLVLLFLVGYVVPRFAGVYQDMGDRLPAASRVLLWLGQGIDAHGWFVLAGLVAVVAAGIVAARSGAASATAMRLLHRVPRLRDVLAAADFARMYRTLALLVHGGIPMVSALEIVRGLLPTHLASRLDTARTAIAEGQSFAASMAAQGLATVVADRFFRVGERSGNLAEMIDRAADFHEEEVSRGAEWLGRVVGPVLMLAMGIVIGIVVVLLYLPIFQLTDAIQ